MYIQPQWSGSGFGRCIIWSRSTYPFSVISPSCSRSQPPSKVSVLWAMVWQLPQCVPSYRAFATGIKHISCQQKHRGLTSNSWSSSASLSCNSGLISSIFADAPNSANNLGSNFHHDGEPWIVWRVKNIGLAIVKKASWTSSSKEISRRQTRVPRLHFSPCSRHDRHR